MQLDKPTIDIIHNFAKLNPGLVFKAGNVVMTKSNNAEVPIVRVEFAKVQFPVDFALFNLQKFLSVYSMLNQPTLEFTNTHLIISDPEKRSAKIRFTAPGLIRAPNYDKQIDINRTGVDFEFELSETNLKYLDKAISAFSAPEIALIGDGDNVTLGTDSASNDGVDKFSINVGKSDRVFKIFLSSQHLNLLSRSYTVRVSFKGLWEFHSEIEHNTIKYWVTMSEKSKIGS